MEYWVNSPPWQINSQAVSLKYINYAGQRYVKQKIRLQHFRGVGGVAESMW